MHGRIVGDIQTISSREGRDWRLWPRWPEEIMQAAQARLQAWEMHEPSVRERRGELGLRKTRSLRLLSRISSRRREDESLEIGRVCCLAGLHIPMTSRASPSHRPPFGPWGFSPLPGSACFPCKSLRWLLKLIMKSPEDMLTKHHCVQHTDVHMHTHTPESNTGHASTTTTMTGAGLPRELTSWRRQDSRFQPAVQGVSFLACLLFTGGREILSEILTRIAQWPAFPPACWQHLHLPQRGAPSSV